MNPISAKQTPGLQGGLITKFRFRLGTLLAVLTAIALAFGWWAAGAHRQRKAVTQLQRLEATVVYRNDLGKRQPGALDWVRGWMGRDFFDDVVLIQFRNPTIIRDADLEPLEDLPDIEVLWLHETQLTDDGLVHVAHLSRLKDLVIYHTHVTDKGFCHFEKLRSLESLNMHGLPIGDAGFSHLAALHNLKELSASYTQVTDAGKAYLVNLSRLEELDVSNCKITDDGMRHLRNLRELKELGLSGNQITSDGLRHLARLENLERLELASCPVDDRAIEQFAKLPRLRRLHVGFTHMTYAGIKSLWAGQLSTGKRSVYIDGDSFKDLWDDPAFKKYLETGPSGFGWNWSEIEVGPTLTRAPY